MKPFPFAVSIAVFSLVVSAARGQVFDVAADWNDGVNPNGAWAYRQGNALLGSVASYVPGGFAGPQPAYANAPIGSGHVPACFKLVAPLGAGWDVIPGDVLMHSRDNANGGTNGEGSIVWTAPINGSVSIAGSVWISRDIGRSLVWNLRHNGTLLTSGGVASGDSYSRANPMALGAGSGGPFVLHAIAVNPGDTIAFENLTAPASPYGDLIAINLGISYGAPIAAAVSVGVGCGAAPNVPVLSATPPTIGGPFLLSISNGTPNKAGALVFSAVAAGSIGIGGGCNVYLDLPTAAELFPIGTNATGSGSFPVSVPFVPAIAGASAALQAVLLATPGPLGFDLTNGVVVTIGY